MHLLSKNGLWTDLPILRIVLRLLDGLVIEWVKIDSENDGEGGAIIFGRLFRLHEDCEVVNKHGGMG